MGCCDMTRLLLKQGRAVVGRAGLFQAGQGYC